MKLFQFSQFHSSEVCVCVCVIIQRALWKLLPYFCQNRFINRHKKYILKSLKHYFRFEYHYFVSNEMLKGSAVNTAWTGSFNQMTYNEENVWNWPVQTFTEVNRIWAAKPCARIVAKGKEVKAFSMIWRKPFLGARMLKSRQRIQWPMYKNVKRSLAYLWSFHLVASRGRKVGRK